MHKGISVQSGRMCSGMPVKNAFVLPFFLCELDAMNFIIQLWVSKSCVECQSQGKHTHPAAGL